MGYLGIALLMFAETVFPPIPSELVMPLAGLGAASGERCLAGVIAAGVFGAMAGNVVWYLAARAIGIDRFHGLIDRHGRWLAMDWPDVERAQIGLKRHGAAFVFLGRLLPTIRSVVSIPAGLLVMSFPRFFIWSSIGTAIWTAALSIAGFLLGQRYSAISRYLGPISTTVIVVLVCVYIWRVATWNRRR